jgi:hypothetical protein
LASSQRRLLLYPFAGEIQGKKGGYKDLRCLRQFVGDLLVKDVFDSEGTNKFAGFIFE